MIGRNSSTDMNRSVSLLVITVCLYCTMNTIIFLVTKLFLTFCVCRELLNMNAQYLMRLLLVIILYDNLTPLSALGICNSRSLVRVPYALKNLLNLHTVEQHDSYFPFTLLFITLKSELLYFSSTSTNFEVSKGNAYFIFFFQIFNIFF